jgi:uncharacterized cupredoxin-like copper-binding protein
LGRIIATSLAALSVAALLGTAAPALAEGNLAAKATNLDDLTIDMNGLKFSKTEYDLETGKYYNLNVVCDDSADDTALMAPEFFRNVWVNQIAIDDLEIKSYGTYSLECDTAGTFVVTFVPIRPGEYDFYVPGYEDRGLKGKFVVK